MEARDTVMSMDDLLQAGVDFNKHMVFWFSKSLKLQDEISFKAGCDEAVKNLHSPEIPAIAKDGLEKAELRGRREVVEWLHSEEFKKILTALELLSGQELVPYKKGVGTSERLTGYGVAHLLIQGLHAKLKEWGLNDDK